MLAIAGGKGGVGKTTTTLGLAAALPGRPLVVDADRDMPDLHALAAVNRSPRLDAVLAEDVETAQPATAAAGSEEGANVHASPESATDTKSESTTVLGQSCPDHDCRVLPAPGGDAPRTDKLLDRLVTEYDTRENGAGAPILVDTPAGVSVDAAAPLQAVDGVVLVSTACAPALRDAAKTASMARAVGTAVVGVVLTRTVARPPGVDDLLDCPVLGCVPSVTGRPLEHNRVRERYEAVATRLTGANSPLPSSEELGCTERF